MADLQKTIEIVFGGKDELSGKVLGIEKSIDNLDKSVSKITDPLAAAGESVLKFSAALSALVVGGMAYAIKTAGEFGGQFAEITTLFDATGENVDKFRNDILNYSTDSVKSIEDINKATYAAISAGIDYKDSLEFLSVAEKLSVAGKADLEATTKVLVSTLNAYGVGVDQAEKYSDLFFQTVKIGQTTMPELAASMAQVTSIAAAGGVPIETLTAAIATLTAKGMPTSQAITSIRGALVALVKPTGEAAEMARTLGIDFSASALASKGFDGVLRDVMNATGGNVDMIAKLFTGVEGLGAALSLGADDAVQFTKAIDSMKESAGATAAGYEKMAQEFEQVNQKMANAFKVSLISIGDQILPAYGAIVGELAGMFKGIKSGVDAGAFDDLFAIFDSLGDQIGIKLQEVAAVLPDALKNLDFTKLADALKSAGKALSDGFGEVTMQKVAQAMQSVIDSFASLFSMSKGIIETFGLVAITVKEAVIAFNKLDNTTQELIGNLMGFGMVYKTMGMFGKSLGQIGIIMMALGTDAEAAGRIFSLFFLSVENGGNVIKVVFNALAVAFWGMVHGFNSFLDAVPGLDFSKEVEQSGKSLDEVQGKLSSATDDLFNSTEKWHRAWSGTGESADGAKKKVSAFDEAIKGLPEEAKTEIKATGAENAEKRIKEISATIAGIPASKETKIEVRADGSSIEKAHGMIIERFPDGTISITNVEVAADKNSMDKAKKEIEKEIPAEKIMEITANVDIARIKEQSAIIQTMTEWKAKVDIAQIEAATEKMKTMFASVDTAIKSTGEVMVGLAGAMGGVGGSRQLDLVRLLENEARLRERALDMQSGLIAADIENIKATTKLLKEGKDIGIKVSAEGLAPHLEAFMFEILKFIQIRATAESANFLVDGLTKKK